MYLLKGHVQQHKKKGTTNSASLVAGTTVDSRFRVNDATGCSWLLYVLSASIYWLSSVPELPPAPRHMQPRQTVNREQVIMSFFASDRVQPCIRSRDTAICSSGSI
eukprot:gb/GECG01010399.1/.p1 GENE.gb/GECG01010399.1/~~gb/GECG01010399.1/.p1  ORF type:complete len:106 (+),score=6.31 gb/GECG01010399.1/:1-318(+)